MAGVSKLLTDQIALLAESGLQKENNLKNKLKLLAIIYAKEHGIKKAAGMYKVSPSAITEWIHRLREESLEGLKDKPKKPRSPHYTQDQKKAIEKLLSNDSGITIEALKVKIEKALGFKMSYTTTYKTMQELGFTYHKKEQKPYSKFKKEADKKRWRRSKN
jgi:transposase